MGVPCPTCSCWGGGLPAVAQQLDPGRSWQSRLPPGVMLQRAARQQRQVNAPHGVGLSLCHCTKHPQNMAKQTETQRHTLVAIKQWLSNPAFSPRASPNILQSQSCFLGIPGNRGDSQVSHWGFVKIPPSPSVWVLGVSDSPGQPQGGGLAKEQGTAAGGGEGLR